MRDRTLPAVTQGQEVVLTMGVYHQKRDTLSTVIGGSLVGRTWKRDLLILPGC